MSRLSYALPAALVFCVLVYGFFIISKTSSGFTPLATPCPAPVCPTPVCPTPICPTPVCPSLTCPTCPSSSLTSSPENYSCPIATCPSSPPIECPTCAPIPPPPTPCPVPKDNGPAKGQLYSQKRANARLVVDIFTFGHELDWLDIRLNEYNDVVDYFVLMEGSRTFSDKEKPMVYLENMDKFSSFNDKIIHVNCTPHVPYGYFQIEWAVRRCIGMGISKVEERAGGRWAPEDVIIMLSDVDEFPRTSLVKDMKWFDPIDPLPGSIMHRFYYYNFHWFIGDWRGTRIFTLKDFKAQGNDFTWHDNDDVRVMKTNFQNGGWHCSSCLTIDALIYKIQTFSHVEFNRPDVVDKAHLQDVIENGKDFAKRAGIHPLYPTPYLGDIPKYILQNMDKYPYIVPLSKYNKSVVLEASLRYMDEART